MIVPRYSALAFLASSAATVGAFTAPRTSLRINHVVAPNTGPAQFHLVAHSSFDPSLQFWKKDKVEEELPKAVGSVEAFDNGKNDLTAPTIYAAYTIILILVIYELRDAIVTTTLGSKALALVTGALIWDNMIISIGSFFFKDIATNPKKYKILETLSIPRFTLHAVGVPLQCITVAEMGKVAGVEFLQSDLVQMGVFAAAIVVAVADRIKFAQSPGIEQTVYDQPPFDALERDLVKFGYKVIDFSFVIPAIILSLFNLIVGIEALKVGTDPELAKWMIFAGTSALVGNALPGSVNAFSGNLGEAGMQYGLLNAARIVYGGM